MQYLILIVAVMTAACSGSNPAAPTPPPVVQPQPVTLSVRLTATNGGQPLAGVSVTAGTFSAATNGEGGVQYQTLPQPNVGLSFSGAGIVPRTVFAAAMISRDVSVDAIPTAGFDLNFYRQMVRNGFEKPEALEPLRRLPGAPQIYLKTVDEAGVAIDARTLDATTRAIVETATLFTGGRFGVAGLERGTDTRQGQAGWLTVRWSPAPVPGSCGSSNVGVSGGVIDLSYKNGGNCRCAGVSEIRPRTVRHELGHAFGFWHTDSPTDLMSGQGVVGCDALPSARERAAAAIAYARPVGNTDPDQDPSSVVTLSPMRAQ